MKVTPKVPTGETAVRIGDLSVGTCFIDGGTLFMITDIDSDPTDPIIIDLADGCQSEYGDDIFVVPVDCTIAWTKKKAKKRKK